MTVTTKSRFALAALALSTLGLSACTNSVPPGGEVADDIIDTLDVTDAQKACLHKAVANFTIPVAVGDKWDNIDDVAADAAADPPNDKSAQAQGILDSFFESAFENCRDAVASETSSTAGDSATSSANG